MSLLSVDELRDLVASDLADDQLQTLIDREESALTARYGPPGDGVSTVAQTLRAYGGALFLPRAALSVSTITEATTLGGTPATLSATDYAVDVDAGSITRLPEGRAWGRVVAVTYVPVDDRALRTQVLIELCRLALSQTALKSESVAGEYSLSAPDDWEHQRAQIARRLALPSI